MVSVYTKKDIDPNAVKKGGTNPQQSAAQQNTPQQNTPQQNTPQQNTPQQNTTPQAEETQHSPQPTNMKDKNNLNNLLTRAKNTTPQTAPAPQTSTQAPAAMNYKPDDEIIQLMEDDDVVENDTDDQPIPQPVAQDIIIPQPIAQPTNCSQIIPPGRMCKNTAKSNGKCARHGGV